MSKINGGDEMINRNNKLVTELQKMNESFDVITEILASIRDKL